MQETLKKIINNVRESKEAAEVMTAYYRWVASSKEDEKERAQLNVQADSFEATIDEKNKQIESMEAYLKTLEPVPSPFN